MGKSKKPAKLAGRAKDSAGAVAGDKNARYVVVRTDDVTVTKYQIGTRAPEGHEYEQALSLALPARDGDEQIYGVVTVAEFEAARESEEKVSLRDIARGRVAAKAAGDDVAEAA